MKIQTSLQLKTCTLKEMSNWTSLRFYTFLKFPIFAAPFTTNIFTHRPNTFFTTQNEQLPDKILEGKILTFSGS